MTQVDNSNALASRNGCNIEHIITTLYPGAEFDYKGLIDLTINGIRCEIKSCQSSVKDSHNSGGSRCGRFVFNEEQHLSLIENEGEYIFIVHKEGVPFLYYRVPARNVVLSKFAGLKCVSWKTVLMEAI